MSVELKSAKEKLSSLSEEGEVLRQAATSLAKSKSMLEAQQQQLVDTAKQALGRHESVEGAAKAAEAAMEAAQTKAERLSAEVLHLRWAISQTEERLKETAEECAKLVAERDVAASELLLVRQAEEKGSQELLTLRRRVTELEAVTLADRNEYESRLAEAEQKARGATEAISYSRRLEEKLRQELMARAAESVAHEKQRVLLARLLELEGTFGAMLQPRGAHATADGGAAGHLTPYAVALHDLAKEEMRLPPQVREAATPSSKLPPPLLVGPLPGHEARLAARAAVSTELAQMRDPSSVPRGGVGAGGGGAGGGTLSATAAGGASSVKALPGSMSLPLLRTGIRTPVQGARPLPVARGSARVQQRRSGGVSAGTGAMGNEAQALAHALQSRVRP